MLQHKMKIIWCTIATKLLTTNIFYQINVKMLKIATLKPKNHKQTSLIFDESLSRIDYNELQDLEELGMPLFSTGWLEVMCCLINKLA